MQPHSIIVYRNPIEQQMWEGTVCGIPIIFFAFLFAIVVVGLFVAGTYVYQWIQRCNRNRRNKQFQSDDYWRK